MLVTILCCTLSWCLEAPEFEPQTESRTSRLIADEIRVSGLSVPASLKGVDGILECSNCSLEFGEGVRARAQNARIDLRTGKLLMTGTESDPVEIRYLGTDPKTPDVEIRARRLHVQLKMDSPNPQDAYRRSSTADQQPSQSSPPIPELPRPR